MADDLERLKAEYADRARRLAGSDVYSMLNPANLFIIQGRQRAIVNALRRSKIDDLAQAHILELGCGAGGVLAELATIGAARNNLFGVDVLPDRLAQAQAATGLGNLSCADGRSLPYASNQFDLVLQFTVFSSILEDGIKARLAGEMLRVARPKGLLLWYDFWLNPTNPQTRGIRPAEIRRLFPGCQIHLRKITLAPPIARRVVPVSWGLAHWLESLGIFNSHYLAAIRPLE